MERQRYICVHMIIHHLSNMNPSRIHYASIMNPLVNPI